MHGHKHDRRRCACAWVKTKRRYEMRIGRCMHIVCIAINENIAIASDIATGVAVAVRLRRANVCIRPCLAKSSRRHIC